MIERSQLYFHDETPRALGRLTLAGTLKNSRGLSQMRVFGQRALVLLVAGAGRYHDARGQYDVSAGDAVLVFPRLPHRYGPRAGADWDEIYLCFDGPIFDLWESEGILDSKRPLARVDVGATFAAMRALGEMARPSDDAENWAQLQILLGLLLKLFPPQPHQNEPDWLSEARALLGANLSAPLAMPDVARAVGLSYAAFRREFVALAGVSPLQFRAGKRLEAARVLLERGEMTNAAIARNLGYGDEAHFSKAFKRATGRSPRAWKRAVVRSL